MREDRFTTTPADAEWFERQRGGGYGPSDDVPSWADVDPDLDRAAEQRREREDASLRERGLYVPTSRDRLAASLATLAMTMAHRADVEFTPVRAQVFRIDHARPLSAEEVAGVLSGNWEVVERDGILWARVGEDYLSDPMYGPLPDRPPF